MELDTTNFQHEPSDIRIDGPGKPVYRLPVQLCSFRFNGWWFGGFYYRLTHLRCWLP
jgi:hypothetical protein